MEKYLITTFVVGNKQVNLWYYPDDPEFIEVECIEIITATQ
jgi:hypothetical protein